MGTSPRAANSKESFPEYQSPAYLVSLISDSNFSVQELTYLRYLFAENFGRPTSVHRMILCYLWHTYGFTFSNSASPVLRYGAMLRISKRPVGNRVPTEYYQYLSQFHNGLLLAIKDNTVDESHLFGLFFAVMSDRNWRDRLLRGVIIYQYLPIFCATLEHLLR